MLPVNTPLYVSLATRPRAGWKDTERVLISDIFEMVQHRLTTYTTIVFKNGTTFQTPESKNQIERKIAFAKERASYAESKSE